MAQIAREHPDDWAERLEVMLDHADATKNRCPHGEDHWKDCQTCVDDERGVRQWERSLDK